MNHNGKLIASAVAAVFALSSGCSTLQSDAALVDGDTLVRCAGINECAGTSECASASDENSCQGQNECAGQGWVTVSADDCVDEGGENLGEA
jgi:uncharacterized membrane protein